MLKASVIWSGSTPQDFLPRAVLPHLPHTVAQRLGELTNRSWHENEWQTERWNEAAASAAAAGVLRVSVIGTSVSNGCGACDYDPTDTFYGESSTASEFGCSENRYCSKELSWLRVMQAHVEQTNLSRRVHMHVAAKNAVGPDFFLACTQSKIPRDSHVVLIDVATNLFAGSVSSLITHVHAAAPSAAIAFIDWTSRISCEAAGRDTSEREILEAARSRASPADVLRVLPLARALVSEGHGRDACRHLYALRGKDNVHPRLDYYSGK